MRIRWQRHNAAEASRHHIELWSTAGKLIMMSTRSDSLTYRSTCQERQAHLKFKAALFGQLSCSGVAHSKPFRTVSKMGDRSGEVQPPFSRLFVVCSKAHTDEELRAAFDAHGQVEDVWIVKDKQTRESKGIAYIKYSRASSAAIAVEKLDGTSVGNDTKVLKVRTFFFFFFFDEVSQRHVIISFVCCLSGNAILPLWCGCSVGMEYFAAAASV